MYKLDKSKSVELDISNDAFYLFTEDDEPIDESCYDEINNLYAKYESFEIEKIKDLNNGLIKVLLTPYIETDQSWDYFISTFNNWILNIKILSDTEALIQSEQVSTGKIGHCVKGQIVEINNKKWIKYKNTETQRVYNQFPLFKASKY